MATTDPNWLPMHLKVLNRKPPDRQNHRQRVTFFSLPQRVRQTILYSTLDEETFRRLAQLTLRLSQDKSLNDQGHPGVFLFFIKRYCRKLAVHWLIFHDLILVRRCWQARFDWYEVAYRDGSYRINGPETWWSAEGDLHDLEEKQGIDGTRSTIVQGGGYKGWTELHCERDILRRRGIATFSKQLSEYSFSKRRPSKLTLKYHPSKTYPSLPTSSTPLFSMPAELRQKILIESLPLLFIRRLANIQLHFKRTATRFVASLILQLAEVHQGLIPDLVYVQKYWNKEVQENIDEFRAECKSKYQDVVEAYRQKRRGLKTEEECDAIGKLLRNYQAKFSRTICGLDLTALEDIYHTKTEHRSLVAKREIDQFMGPRTRLLGTIDWTYRWKPGKNGPEYPRERYFSL